MRWVVALLSAPLIALSSPVQAQNDLTQYVSHYPSEKVNGRSLLDVIQKTFISTFGIERWRRLVGYPPIPTSRDSRRTLVSLGDLGVVRPKSCRMIA